MGLREINEKRTRELIEQKARELFCAKGIGETDLKEIAEAVGIPRTTFYTYYRDKNELATAVYLRNLQALLKPLELKALEKRWKACKGDVRAFIVGVTDASIAHFVKDPDVHLYDFAYNLQAAKAHQDPTALAGHAADAAAGMAFYAERVEEAIREGELRGCENNQDFQDRVVFPLLAYFVRLAVFERHKPQPDYAAAAHKAQDFRDLLLMGAFGSRGE